MKLIPASLLWILVTAWALPAQNPSSSNQAPTQATLSGVVTKENGSEPIKKALIELIRESQNDGGNYTALTAADGAFRIENIAPGSYRLFVERTGYQEVDKHHRRTEGRTITLSAGDEIKDLAIRLQAAAVIEGRVTDEDGDPMTEAQVTVFRQTFVSGRSQWEQAGAERTNDLGEYRIANLSASKYFVSVTPPPDFRSLIETAKPVTSTPNAFSEKPSPTAYQTAYYPGTSDRSQAAPIQLRAGDDFPANFSLSPSPSLTIRGSVVNLPPGVTATISLQSRDFNLVLNGAEMHKDGSFEIRDVSPGAYTIVAMVENSAVPMMARQSLQLSESVDSIRLAPQAGGTVRGRIRLETNATSRPDPSQLFLSLRSAEGNDSAFGNAVLGSDFSSVAHVSADGSFAWSDVPAGRYFVQLSDASAMPDWFLQSVATGGRDAGTSGFEVSGGATTLDLVASGAGAGVEGIVSDGKEKLVADATVVAVPEPRFRGQFDRYRKASADQAGHFILRGLAPGAYTIFAWESVEGEAYYNPEFLKSCEGQGKTIRIGEGERVSIQLLSIPEADDGHLAH